MIQHIHWEATAENMYSLDLSPGFHPLNKTTNTIQYEKSMFRGGEINLKLKTEIYSGRVWITKQYNSPSDMVEILMANDALKRMGASQVSLFLPYFPGARQDRICDQGESFTLKVHADMINSCGFDSVVICSPHSDVTPALINNVKIKDIDTVFISDIITSLDRGSKSDYNLIIPDAGASKRVMEIAKKLQVVFPDKKFNLIRCEKVRDIKTGQIKEIVVHCDKWNGLPGILTDDVNCLGGTFIGIAKELQKKGFFKTHLYTSHSDCEEGIKNVSPYFDNVWTTNSKANYKSESNVIIFEL